MARPIRFLRGKIQTFALLGVFIVLFSLAIYQTYAPSPSRRFKALHGEGGGCSSPFEKMKLVAVPVYFCGVLSMFLGVAIVCHNYFIVALQVVNSRVNVSDDVAGATYMAAATSSPELFASLVGTFMGKADVGVGTVAGSAVFNVLVIVGLAGVVAPSVIKLDWRPFCRDTFFFVVSVCLVYYTCSDHSVQFSDGVIFLIAYAVYITYMILNARINARFCPSNEFDEDTVFVIEEGNDDADAYTGGDHVSLSVPPKQGPKKSVSLANEVVLAEYRARRPTRHSASSTSSSTTTSSSSSTASIPLHMDQYDEGVPEPEMIENGSKHRSSRREKSQRIGPQGRLTVIPMKPGHHAEDDAPSDSNNNNNNNSGEQQPPSPRGRARPAGVTLQRQSTGIERRFSSDFLGGDNMSVVSGASNMSRISKISASRVDISAAAMRMSNPFNKIGRKNTNEAIVTTRGSNSGATASRPPLSSGSGMGSIGGARPDANGAINFSFDSATQENNQARQPATLGVSPPGSARIIDDGNISGPERPTRATLGGGGGLARGGLGNYPGGGRGGFGGGGLSEDDRRNGVSDTERRPVRPVIILPTDYPFQASLMSEGEQSGNERRAKRLQMLADAEEDARVASVVAAHAEEQTWESMSFRQRVVYAASMPFQYLFSYTIPDCDEEKYKKGAWFALSILMSVSYIGIFTYFLVLWTETIGCIVGLSSDIMAMTVLAAGSSTPDALASMAVAKRGQGGMAISITMGCNVFNVLFGLGLPWFLYTLYYKTTLELASDQLTNLVIILIFVSFYTLVAFLISKWNLSRNTGAALFALYGVFCLYVGANAKGYI